MNFTDEQVTGKMDPEVKKLWVPALLNGEYEQTLGSLRDQRGFCCLGVLCDLYQKHTGKGEWASYRTDKSFTGETEEYNLPPIDVLMWAGLDNNNPIVRAEPVFAIASGKPFAELAYLNDSGYSFAQIAEIIEEQL